MGRHYVPPLAGDAELLERFGLGRVQSGFVVLLPEERVALEPAERAALWAAVRETREMAERERLPAQTQHRRYCADWELVNDCGDVGRAPRGGLSRSHNWRTPGPTRRFWAR